MKKLFIGNLPYQATESELQQWLVDAGVTAESLVIMRDKFSGASRGFAFAEISDDGMAERAVASCNGKSFSGRQLVVNEARPMGERGDRPQGSGGRGGGGGGRKERGGYNRY